MFPTTSSSPGPGQGDLNNWALVAKQIILAPGSRSPDARELNVATDCTGTDAPGQGLRICQSEDMLKFNHVSGSDNDPAVRAFTLRNKFCQSLAQSVESHARPRQELFFAKPYPFLDPLPRMTMTMTMIASMIGCNDDEDDD